jgi:hypothetical protein
MKPRKWVIVFAVFAFLCGSVVYKGITFLEENKNIERFMGEAVSSSIKGHFSVDRVRIGFLSIYLENVTIALATHYYTASVRDIKISFSLLKLIRSRGNIAQSISKIILICPQVDISLKNIRGAFASGTTVGFSMPSSQKNADLYSLVNNFPINQFLIRKGVVRVFGIENEALALGEDCSGNLRNDAAGIYFELRGALASRKKNLFISGIFSRKYQRNHISVRLDKANIGKPIRWQTVELRSGTLDGTCEFSFPDILTAKTFESAGWVHIRNADVAVDKIEKPISSAMLSMSLANTILRIDSSGCIWNGVKVKVGGTWDPIFKTDSTCAMTVECEGLRLESLFPTISAALSEKVRGIGWVKATVAQRTLTSETSFTVAGGGIKTLGIPLLFSAKGFLSSSQISMDTFVIRAPGALAAGSGIVNFEKSMPAYSISYSLQTDSVPQLPALQGSKKLFAHGSLHGLGTKTHLEAVIGAEKAYFFGVPIGSPDVSLRMDDFKRLAFDFSPNNAAFLRASGTLDSISFKNPRLQATVAAGDSAIKSMLGKNNAAVARLLDSAGINAVVSLSGGRLTMHGVASICCPPVRGAVRFQIDRNLENSTTFWRFSPQQLMVNDSPIVCGGKGSFTENVVTIDSFATSCGIRGSGRYDLNLTSLEALLHYRDVSLCALNTWFFNRRLPVKSGALSGMTRISGVHGRISTDSDLHVRRAAIGYLTNIEADPAIKSKETLLTILPMTIRKDNKELLWLDTISNRNGSVFSGHFNNISLHSLFSPESIIDDTGAGQNDIQGNCSGQFKSLTTGLPLSFTATCPFMSIGKWRIDSVCTRVVVSDRGCTIKELSASDGGRASILCSGSVPWAVFTNENNGDSTVHPDTMNLRLNVDGDLLASIEKNVGGLFGAPIAGTGRGSIEIQLQGTPGNVHICKAKGGIARGTLRVKPYVREDIKDFSFFLTMEDPDSTYAGVDSSSPSANITITMNGTIGKRPIRINSIHKIPDGFEPFRIGFLDMGIIQVSTPKGGVDLNVPGLMEPAATAEVEFAPKHPFKAFTISGPLHRPCITGTWILRDGEFTYPFLKTGATASELNLFPYIVWDFDLKAANRKVKYYYDATAKTTKILRLVECYLDPVSSLSIRGCDKDKTFKLLGALRSYKGSVFFRKVFDLNFEVGLDFTPQPLPSGKGFDNRPIIWGSAEALSEKNRFDRTKVTLVTRDSITGALSEKGRFYGMRFKVTSDAEEIPGELETDFFSTQEGKRAASMEGAGELVSTVGEQYVHRFLLQNLESRLAKSLGLDVITFETSIASNYFNKIYNKQVVNLSYDWNYLAFANVGITFGRYFFYDKVFFKWRTELIPVDMLIRPEYTMGFEFQPLNYFMMDFDYGMRIGQKSLEQNPKVYMQLRLPIEGVRKYFNF